MGMFGLFFVYPFIQTLILSFHEWDGFGDPKWVGTSNYFRGEEGGLSVASDKVFHRALMNNALYWMITLVTEVGVGLILAAIVVRCRKGATFYRLALTSPLMIALVASAVLFHQLLAERGILNSALRGVGLDFLAQSWTSERWMVVTVGMISGWAYAGFYLLIFSAGLERIPRELREAAQIDGANEWDVFSKIEWPLLRPVIAVTVLMCSTGAFRAFDLFYVMVGRGLSSRTEVASTWLVKNAFLSRYFGYASALAAVVVLIVMILAATLSRWVSRERELEQF